MDLCTKVKFHQSLKVPPVYVLEAVIVAVGISIFVLWRFDMFVVIMMCVVDRELSA